MSDTLPFDVKAVIEQAKMNDQNNAPTQEEAIASIKRKMRKEALERQAKNKRKPTAVQTKKKKAQAAMAKASKRKNRR